MSNRYVGAGSSCHGTMRRLAEPAATRGPCNLDSRIRLLQSKLHPLSVAPMHHFQEDQQQQLQARGEEDELAGSGKLEWRPINKWPPPPPSAANRLSAMNGASTTASGQELEDEGDSLSLCSSLASSSSSASSASSSSSTSSAAPTPPPRLSSLRQSSSQQRASSYLSASSAARSQASNININNHLPIAHQPTVVLVEEGDEEAGLKQRAHCQSSDTPPGYSYTNQLVPTRTSPTKVNNSNLHLTKHQSPQPHHQQIPTTSAMPLDKMRLDPRGATNCFLSAGQAWSSASSSGAPLTKAVQHQYLLKQQQQHPQSLHVVNVPASRRPITALYDNKPRSRQLNSSSSQATHKLAGSNIHLISTAIQQRPHSALDSAKNNNNNHHHLCKIADNSLQLLVPDNSQPEARSRQATRDAASAAVLSIQQQAPASSINNNNNNSREAAPASQNSAADCKPLSSQLQPDTRPTVAVDQASGGQRVSPSSSSSCCWQPAPSPSSKAAATEQPQPQQQPQPQSTGESTQHQPEPQLCQRQRQTELLQLMQLRQVQHRQCMGSPAIKSTFAGSHELPTLEQVQQRLRSSKAPHTSPQWQPHNQKRALEPALLPQQRPQQQAHSHSHLQPQQLHSRAMPQASNRSQATQEPIQEPHLHNQQPATLAAASSERRLHEEEEEKEDAALATSRPQQTANLLTTAHGGSNTSPQPPGLLQSQRLQLSIQTSGAGLHENQQPAGGSSSSNKTPQHQPASSMAAASPANSILSDSATEAAMNSAQLIPKLIERLDRKLVVMKDEQLSLMREIQLNECNGSRLFRSLEAHLSAPELDKVSLHAAEIEKVTKLILSLKLRLKRVQAELEQRLHQSRRQAAPPSITQPSSNRPQQQQQQQQPDSSQLKQQQQQQPKQLAGLQARGISDPTSTGRAPKRNHQHHASLQPDTGSGARSGHLLLEANVGGGSSSTTGSPQNHCRGDKCLREEEQEQELEETEAAASELSRAKPGASACDTGTGSSSSRDSIFNCDDSAIGSTITGHGGSANNIGAHHGGQLQAGGCNMAACSQSSLSSYNSSTNSAPNHGLLHLEACNLSSSISVSSQGSSVGSVPSSPPLVSPTLNPNTRQSTVALERQQQQHQPQNLFKLSAPHDANNNNNNNNSTTANQPETGNVLMPLTDLDILAAKRDKLISQLEEAHQLEECIAHRNNVIIQRILSKYYCHQPPAPDNQQQNTEPSEIEEFRQFTRLKSLLLKDMHDIAERIESAELQLTELSNILASVPATNNTPLDPPTTAASGASHHLSPPRETERCPRQCDTQEAI